MNIAQANAFIQGLKHSMEHAETHFSPVCIPLCMPHTVQALLKLLDDEGKVTDKKLQDMRVDLLREVGWGLWADHHKSWNRIRFPTQYPVF